MQTTLREQFLADSLGRLTLETPEQKKQFEELQSLVVRTAVADAARPSRGRRLSFEDADLFALERIPEERAATIRRLARAESDAVYRLFVRETPVRSPQLHASSPRWAAGAAVARTLGPFRTSDGRLFWFDFFKTQKLTALYVQGHPQPALLFTVESPQRPPSGSRGSHYSLRAGSVWIRSKLLAATAPEGDFTGLNLRGGLLTLSAGPQAAGDSLIVSANTVVTIQLDLAPPPAADADPRSSFGADAREMTVETPRRLAFHFSGAAGVTAGVDEVGDASWNVYGHQASFRWNSRATSTYDGALQRLLIPFQASTPDFQVGRSQSAFHTLEGRAAITGSFWALSSASIDVANPPAAEGAGALLLRAGVGLSVRWPGLKGGRVSLKQPNLMAAPGSIAVSDPEAGGVFCHQDFELWQDAERPFPSSVHLRYPGAPFFYGAEASGVELLMTSAQAEVKADRPVTARGDALEMRSRDSILLLAASDAFRMIYLFDDDILLDNADPTAKPAIWPKPISLALHNALFKVTPVNGCLLFGSLAANFEKVEKGLLYLSFGLLAYIPTLPDPYAANLSRLRYQLRSASTAPAAGAAFQQQTIWLWLVGRVSWTAGGDGADAVETSFHFAPLQGQSPSTGAAPAGEPAGFLAASGGAAAAGVAPKAFSTSHPAQSAIDHGLPNYGGIWEETTQRLRDDHFSLLDVSTRADLLGVSFGYFNDRRYAMVPTLAPGAAWPLAVQGMDVVSPGHNARVFTVPQISWEPVINLTAPSIPGDPAAGANYYPNDGGPTRILNDSAEHVALAPIPLTDFLVESLAEKENFAALAQFTLPFGLNALALLQKQYVDDKGASRRGGMLTFNAKSFPDAITGARQLELDGGQALRQGESDMFMGSTLQLNNILDAAGAATGNSTLGASVTKIFNNEWMLDPFALIRQRGVPLTRIDLSGYGASAFSNWLNPKAAIAETSQAKFDVFVGRTAHEIIQVKSIMYPWAIKVVRTITLFRVGSGYVYRHDTGWRAESDGRFDFTYYVYKDDPQNPGTLIPEERQAKYEIHPGVVKGLFQVKDIRETEEVDRFTGVMQVAPGEMYVDENGKELQNTTGSALSFNLELQPVFFNAEVEIENPVSGFVTQQIGGQEKKLTPSRRILGFVQIAPRGLPLTVNSLRALIQRQGVIGGPIDTVVDIGGSGQQMRLNGFDVSNALAANGSDAIFVAAGRGQVLLPKDGSWSLVKHEYGSGEISPVPANLAAPLIRIGKLVKQGGVLVLDKNPASQLLRIANPTELLRPAVSATLNYGFLQTTDTQKALFLTPAFRPGLDRLLSKTPPLFADAFRIVNSKAIFPNVGNAAGSFGDAISLVKSGAEFVQNALTDGGVPVLELMKINETVAAAKKEGYKLLKQIEAFDLPATDWTLIELGGSFRIYLEYKANDLQQPGGGVKNAAGRLDFDVDSFASGLADQWKSRMNNVAVVVDLGPIDRLMTIKGNWNAQKGVEAQYGGSGTDPDFPAPQIQFAPELKPVIDILQVLQELQGENYKDAFQKGLKLAMSNKAGSWEYKLEASKEIPVVRFPVPAMMYNDPNAPLKLEAGLRLGAYFNAALMVPATPNQLLPTAGAYMGFYGRLSVMCVSLSVATVYAVGQVDLDISADSKTGPALRMKFGFGAQIVVGLPVIGNVSLLYMVGVEIYTDSTTLRVSAFLLFQGRVELVGGLVAVTITIEAKGTIARANNRTDLAAQVTFGLDISIFLVIDISFSTSWQEQRQIA